MRAESLGKVEPDQHRQEILLPEFRKDPGLEQGSFPGSGRTEQDGQPGGEDLTGEIEYLALAAVEQVPVLLGVGGQAGPDVGG